MQLVYYLPRWFARNWKRGILGRTKYPHSLVYEEVRGTIHGVFAYSWLKIRKRFRASKPQAEVTAQPRFVEQSPELTSQDLPRVPTTKAAKLGDAA